MNSFNHLNFSTLFLQIVVVIIKFTSDEEILSVLPQLIGVGISLLLIRSYQVYKQPYGKYIRTIFLLHLLVINIFEETNQLVSMMKYLLVGKFIGKYCNQKSATVLILLLTESTLLLEGFLLKQQLIYILSLGGWFILCFLTPAFIMTKVKKTQEVFQPQQVDVTFLREQQLINESSHLNPLKDQTSTHSNPDFYKDMLQHYPDGIVILEGGSSIVKFMSNSLLRLVQSRSQDKVVSGIMKMRNNFDQIKQEAKMNSMFIALSSKLSPYADEIKANEDNIDYIEQYFSESATVQNEYDVIVQRLEKDLEMGTQRCRQRIRFLYEVKMICSSELDYAGTGYQNNSMQESGYKGPQLFEVTFRPFIFNNQPYIFMILKDVTHFNQIKVLKTINQNKSEMLAQVAHEFRTPLNCIMLLVETLQQQLTPEVNEEFLQPIMISAKTLLSLINDLLDVAQLKAGKFQLVHTLMDLKALLYEIEKFISPQLHMKGNKLRIQVIGNITSKIVSDSNRITQILYNLIGNSNKFTKNGTISIILQQLNDSKYEITVQDTGVGINPIDQTKLFRAFGKLENNKEMNTQGVGLGLMISNVLAERLSILDNPTLDQQQQGLKVFSEGVGKGASFSFVIQAQQQQQIQSSGINMIDSNHHFTRTKTRLDRKFNESAIKRDIYIMIVDDEGFNIHALKKALSVKFTVDGFYSGAEAIERVKEPLPIHTIILQDIEMPQMDGFETTKLIRQIANDKVFIIGCSGQQDTIRQECQRVGMDEFLQKPVRLTDLMRIIDNLF